MFFFLLHRTDDLVVVPHQLLEVVAEGVDRTHLSSFFAGCFGCLAIRWSSLSGLINMIRCREFGAARNPFLLGVDPYLVQLLFRG